MKTIISPFQSGLFAAIMLASAQLCAGQMMDRPITLSPGPYFGGSAGVNFIEDTALRQFAGPTSGGMVRFDPGFAFSVRGGYRFCEWFSLEGETGLHANSIRSITGADRLEANVYQVPLMANALLTLPTRSPVTPFIGAGVGGVENVIDINRLRIPALDPDTLFGADGTFAFAWQGFAGLQFDITERLALGVMYNYRAVESPKWDSDAVVEFGRLRNHTAAVVVNFHF